MSHQVGEPSEDSYDVIVVGGGLGGLSAGAALAKLGQKVLLLERADAVGGCAHAFTRDKYIFDPAVHITGQAHPGEFVDMYLRQLGIRDRVNFIEMQDLYGVDFPDLRVNMPVTREGFIEAHARPFPKEAEGITRFVELCAQLTNESQQMTTRLSLRDLDAAAKQFPTLFRYRTATVGQVLDECLTDPKAKALCGAMWPYVGLPPSQVSFTTYSAIMMMMDGCPFYVEGSFESLVSAFAHAIERDGGEILVNAPVTRITVQEGKVTGVITASGRELHSPSVVSNADATATLVDMLGVEHLTDGYARRLRRMKPSLSAVITFAATSLDISQLGLSHEIFLHRRWDHDAIWQDILGARPGGMWVSLPTLVDPSLAPPGEHLAILTTMMPYDIGRPWDQAKEEYQELMVDELDRIMPGFRSSLTFVESATPQTFERWTGNHRGAIYGWENTPAQCTPKRLPRVTSVQGLLLSSHWTEPGTGAIRAMASGLQTAQIMSGFESGPAFMGALGGSGAGAVH